MTVHSERINHLWGAARYGLRVKYHKATSIDQFGAPYLQLAWAYSAQEPSDDAHMRRQVCPQACAGSFVTCQIVASAEWRAVDR